MGSTYQLWQPILIVYTDDSRSQACAHPLQDRLRRCRGARLHHPNFQLTSEPKPTTRNHRLNREFTKTKHSPRPRHSTHPLHDIEFTPSSENSVRMEAPDMKLITPTLVSRASNLLALISRNSHHLATLSPEFGVSWVTTNDSWISDKKVFAMLKAIISFWPRVWYVLGSDCRRKPLMALVSSCLAQLCIVRWPSHDKAMALQRSLSSCNLLQLIRSLSSRCSWVGASPLTRSLRVSSKISHYELHESSPCMESYSARWSCARRLCCTWELLTPGNFPPLLKLINRIISNIDILLNVHQS